VCATKSFRLNRGDNYGETVWPLEFAGGLLPVDSMVFSTVVVVEPPGPVTVSVVVTFASRWQPPNTAKPKAMQVNNVQTFFMAILLKSE